MIWRAYNPFQFYCSDPFIQIRDITEVSLHACNQFNNTSLAQSCLVLRWDKRYRRRESKNVGFHTTTTAWPAARERERRSKARDRHGRKLVSFVKFLERKVPLRSPSFVIFLVFESALPCPARPELVSDGPGVYNEGITRAYLPDSTLYISSAYSTGSYSISTKLPLTIFQGDCPLNSSF